MSDHHYLLEGSGTDGSYSVRVPNLDRVLSDLLKDWIERMDRTPQDIANATGVSLAEARKAIRGEGASLDFASRCAALLDMKLGDLLDYHPAIGEPKVIDVKASMVRHLGTMFSAEDVAYVYRVSKLLRKHPEYEPALRMGLTAAIETALSSGVDASSLEGLADRIAEFAGESTAG